MKNLKNFKTICLTFSLIMTMVLVQAKNGNPIHTLPIKNASAVTNPVNPVFYELMYKLNHNKCLSISVNSVSIKNKYSFTSYGTASLIKENATTIKTARSVNMEFSDRNNFKGAKTLENIKIYGRSNQISVWIKLVTWGNKTIVLRNVTIRKERYGYFITGRVTDANRTVYYTLGIYETVCLI